MASLGPAVASLRSSLNLLESSISILDAGVSDLPRLTKVLQTQQHFELLPEPTLHEAEQALLDEITPAIGQLLATADAYVGQLARREESLRARAELLEGRLSHGRRSGVGGSLGGAQKNKGLGPATGKARLGGVGGSDAKALELQHLRSKKEALQYSVSRLELESKQRERALRKSMAFGND